MLPNSEIAVVVVRTQGPVNLGQIARLCGNLGLDDLRLVDPQCDIDEDMCRKFANKAWHRLERAPVYADLAQAVADCSQVLGTTARPRDADRAVALGPGQVADWWLQRGGGRLAVVFGNEAHGLSAAELGCCQGFIHLPMPGDYPSYNLAHAVALTMAGVSGLFAAEAAPPSPKWAGAEPALAAERESLARYWIGTVERFGHFEDVARSGWESRFRAWLDRCPLTKADVAALRGSLATCNVKAFGDKAPQMGQTAQAP